MVDQTGTVVSVRASAHRSVMPDSAQLSASITAIADTKADALRDAAAALARLVAQLADFGGTPLRVESERDPLTWSAESATTEPEYAADNATGNFGPTGRTKATVSVQIALRVFEALDRLGRILAAHDALDVRAVSWQVDWDNDAWPQIRAQAVHEAIRKARDYAAALGGALDRIDQIADVGLLSESDGGGSGGAQPVRFAMARLSSSSGESEAPSLDPVPQELIATIDARFTATGVRLA
jgi:uncharacterized protein YggE